MNIDDLIIMGDENIDYSGLSEETLRALAWVEDLFIANSALVELAMRKSGIVAQLAREVLSKSYGDSHLQSSALDILFGLKQEQALDYMMKNVPSCDPYVLSMMMQLMVENEEFFEPALPLAQR